MRVMFLSLPQKNATDSNQFPLGIGYLIGALKNAHEVRAFHFNDGALAQKEINDKIKSFNPDVIGLTCTTFNRGSVKAAIKKIKSINKKIKIIVGGVHASYCYDQIIEKYGADIVVIGEGEITFPKLCSALASNSSLGLVKGIAYNEGGRAILTEKRESIQDLDALPLPDHSYARPFMEKLGMGFIITSRGCPVRCSFCSTSSFWGQRVRMHSVGRVVDEMEIMANKFGLKKIFFYDDTFNLGVDRVKAICAEIKKRNLRVEWACSCRVVPVTEDMLAALVDAGCRHICWGIESGSEEILKNIGKKIFLDQIRNAFELSCKFSALMSTGAFTMVGNQGETAKTINETVDFLNTIPITDAPGTAILCVLPGTVLYEGLKIKGYIRNEDWFKRDTIPMYTVENNLQTMNKWLTRVTQSGKKIPFDHSKHFWSGIISTTNVSLEKKSFARKLVKKILRTIKAPENIATKLRIIFPKKNKINWI